MISCRRVSAGPICASQRRNATWAPCSILTGFGVSPKRKLSQPKSVAPSASAPTSVARAPPLLLADEAAFGEALDALARLDDGFMQTMRAAGGLPLLRRRRSGFAGLAAIIVSQQVSTASANAIFGRLQARFPDLCASDILQASDVELRTCGLSAPKTRTLRAVADAVACGRLDFESLAVLEAEVSHAMLCAIKGVGPWTADIFLLFCLGHADAWPVGDLALQEGARLALGLQARPDAKALLTIGERWRPLRGGAAHCLWAFYGHARARATTRDVAAPATVAGGQRSTGAPSVKAAATGRPSPSRK